jgi:hypothetical protein
MSGGFSGAAAAAMHWARVYTIGATSAVGGAVAGSLTAASALTAKNVLTYPAILKHLHALNSLLAAARSDLEVGSDVITVPIQSAASDGSATSTYASKCTDTNGGSNAANRRTDISAPSHKSRSDTLRLYNAIGRPLEHIPTVIVGGTNGKACFHSLLLA